MKPSKSFHEALSKKTIFSNVKLNSLRKLFFNFCLSFLVMYKTSTILRIETFWPTLPRCCCEASSSDFSWFFKENFSPVVIVLWLSFFNLVVHHRLPMLVEKNKNLYFLSSIYSIWCTNISRSKQYEIFWFGTKNITFRLIIIFSKNLCARWR